MCLFSSRLTGELRAEWDAMMNGIAIPVGQHNVDTFELVHCCYPGAPCKCTSVAHSKRRMKQLLFRVHYRRRPDKPNVSDWTKVRSVEQFTLCLIVWVGLR